MTEEVSLRIEHIHQPGCRQVAQFRDAWYLHLSLLLLS
jgi:hypothetical protein